MGIPHRPVRAAILKIRPFSWANASEPRYGRMSGVMGLWSTACPNACSRASERVVPQRRRASGCESLSSCYIRGFQERGRKRGPLCGHTSSIRSRGVLRRPGKDRATWQISVSSQVVCSMPLSPNCRFCSLNPQQYRRENGATDCAPCPLCR